MKPALTIALLNFICSFVVGYSILVFTQGRYLETAISDTICITLGFSIVKKIAEATTLLERIAYIVSGVGAYQLSIFVVKALHA